MTAVDETALETLDVVHRIAAHVLGRRRHDVSGRFGLRASPGGLATPAFGEGPEVVRVAGSFVVRESGGMSASMPITGSTLRDLARFAGTDIDALFSCGDDTPAVGNPDAPLFVDAEELRRISDWYAMGWTALDAVVMALPPEASPATIQLWPEHLDAATNVGVGKGEERVNLGFSPGDSFETGAYAYVGPWSSARGGDADYWNAPFGAVLRAAGLEGSGAAAQAACVDFLRRGINYASEQGG